MGDEAPLSPLTFTALPLWDLEPHISPTRDTSVAGGGHQRSAGTLALLDNDKEPAKTNVQEYDGPFRRYMSLPGSPNRLVWDLIGALLIFYDMIVIPLNTSFDPPETTFVKFADWLTLIYWSVNMLASLQVGYVEDGVIVMVPQRILKHYLKTWFVVDLIVVVPDCIMSFASLGGSTSASDGGSEVKLLRSLRLVRVVRLLRLFKLKKVMSSLNDHVDSEYLSIVLNVIKMVFALLLVNHFIACWWYVIANTHGGTTWLKEHHFADVDWEEQYAASFHWFVTQFTPSSMHVQPQNMSERCFAILVVVFALVGFSYLVGSITGSLTKLRAMQEDASKQFWILRKYLRQHFVPMELSFRIEKYLEHAYQQKIERLQGGDVKILNLLSEQLADELKCAMAVPHLSVHPLFQHLCEVSPVTMNRLANKAVSQKNLARFDSLFHAHEVATHMYIVMEGRLQYVRVDSAGKEMAEWVDKGEDWISEPALWTSWEHLGMLTAVVPSELMLIDTVRFSEVVHLNPHALEITRIYAFNFLQWLNDQERDSLSDIWQGEDVGEVVKGLIPNVNVNRPSVISLSLQEQPEIPHMQ